MYVPPVPPPNAPSGLTATDVDSTSIRVDWTPGGTSGALQTFEMSTDNFVTNDQILHTDLSDTTATHLESGLTPATTYWFRVKAHNSAGESAYSNVGSATTAASGGRTLLSFPGSFTYLGGFGVNTGVPFDVRYSRGFTFIEEPSDSTNSKHLLLVGGPLGTSSQRHVVIELRVPTSLSSGGSNPLNPNNYSDCTVVKNYVQQPYTDAAGKNYVQQGEITGGNGIGWDSANNRLWWSFSSGYLNTGYIGYATRNYAAGTMVGKGTWVLNSPRYKSTSGGMILAPQSFADTYTGGKRICFGFGGNQSVVAQGDVSQGFALTAIDVINETTYPPDDLNVTDLAGPGGTHVTSASNPFTSGMAGKQVVVTIAGSLILRTISSFVSAGEVVLDSAPSASPFTGGKMQGRGTVIADSDIAKLVGYYPTVATPDSTHGRMNSPSTRDGEPMFGDTWPLDTYYYTDDNYPPVWIDGTNQYGVLAFGTSGLDHTKYLNATIVSTRFRHNVAVYDPSNFAPASGNPYYNIQPTRLDLLASLPCFDYDTYTGTTNPPSFANPPYVTITQITSDPAKKQSNATGCLVTAPGHGISATSTVRIKGSTTEYSSLWNVASIVDADHLYVYNPQNSSFWSGTTDTSAGMQITKAMTYGSSFGSGASGRIVGAAYDPSAKVLYIACTVGWSSGSKVVVLVYQFNDI